MSCWHCGSILVSHTRGVYVAGSSPFTIMTNIFVTEFIEFSEAKTPMGPDPCPVSDLREHFCTISYYPLILLLVPVPFLVPFPLLLVCVGSLSHSTSVSYSIFPLGKKVCELKFETIKLRLNIRCCEQHQISLCGVSGNRI